MSGQKEPTPRKDTRFKPGKSGNPKGRPKKRFSVNEDQLRDTFLYQTMQPVKVRISGKMIEMPKIAAVVEVQLQKALSGNRLSAKWVMEHFHGFVHDRDQMQAYFASLLPEMHRYGDEELDGNAKPAPILLPELPETGPWSLRGKSRNRNRN
jgi:hypothetical protein